jgi:hypothetical protein
MKILHEVLQLVCELNDAPIEHGESGKLVFESTGFHSCVTLGGEIVWDEDEYQAPYIDDGDTQMPLREWFAARISAIATEQSEMARMMCEAAKSTEAFSPH